MNKDSHISPAPFSRCDQLIGELQHIQLLMEKRRQQLHFKMSRMLRGKSGALKQV